MGTLQHSDNVIPSPLRIFSLYFPEATSVAIPSFCEWHPSVFSRTSFHICHICYKSLKDQKDWLQCTSIWGNNLRIMNRLSVLAATPSTNLIIRIYYTMSPDSLAASSNVLCHSMFFVLNRDEQFSRWKHFPKDVQFSGFFYWVYMYVHLNHFSFVFHMYLHQIYCLKPKPNTGFLHTHETKLGIDQKLSLVWESSMGK